MKRPASAAAVAAVAKKAKVQEVLSAMSASEILPKDVASLMQKALPHAVMEWKEERHPFATEIVVMAERALASMDADLSKAAKEAKEKAAKYMNVNAERGRRAATVEAGQKALETATASAVEAHAGAKAAAAAEKEAVAALKAAEKAALKAKSDNAEAEAAKADVEAALSAETLGYLKTEASTTPEGKKALKKIAAVAAEFSFDGGMTTSFTNAVKKGTATRTEFEGYAVVQMETALNKQLQTTTAAITTGLTDITAKIAAVDSASAALTAAKEKTVLCNTQAADCDAAKKEKAKGVATATKTLENYWADTKEAAEASDTSAKDLVDFKGLVEEFVKYKDMETPPEPVEPEEPEEPEAVPMEAEAEAAPAVETVPVAAAE